MSQWLKRYKWQCIVIISIILIQVFFAVQKEGYHMDEMISFEMANAEYNPWIVPRQPVGRLAKFMQEEIEADTIAEKCGNIKAAITDVLQNRSGSKLLTYKADVYEEPVWITNEQFRDYLVTDKKDRFNYLSVYFNVKDDNHPPVHFMLLHTISSLFIGEIHPFMGCFINIIMSVGTAVIMMQCGFLLDRYYITSEGQGEKMGIFAAVIYGSSHGAIATMLLIRMYGVLTFLSIFLFYIHMKKWLGHGFVKGNASLILVTVLGFWTQYFFLFYCISLFGIMCICLFREKRTQELIVYVRSMIIAAIVGVIGFPFAISDVFSSSRGVEALGNLQGGLSEYIERINRFGEILLKRCFGGRVEGIVLLGISLVVMIRLYVKCREHRMIWLMFMIPPCLYFFLAAKMSPMFVDRYLMAIFPFVVSLLVSLFFIKTKYSGRMMDRINVMILSLFCVMQVLTYDGSYLYRGYAKQLEEARRHQDLSCICLYEGSGYYDNLMEFTQYEKTLLVTPQELLERKDTTSVEKLEEVVFLVKHSVSEELLSRVLEKYELQVAEILINEGAHKDRVYLCIGPEER